jgi:hypothetical protein
MSFKSSMKHFIRNNFLPKYMQLLSLALKIAELSRSFGYTYTVTSCIKSNINSGTLFRIGQGSKGKKVT